MRAAFFFASLMAASEAQAHAGHLHVWEPTLTWTWDPQVVLPLGISIVLYQAGVVRLWRRAGIGRGVRAWQAACFVGAWMLLVLALVTPLHWLGERLFVAHMMKHEVLMAAASPLLVIGRPVAVIWAFSATLRRKIGVVGQDPRVARLWAWLTRPLAATSLHGIALWLWHAPSLYELALSNSWMHWLQHLSFFVTALLFWRSLLHSRAATYGAGVFYLFVTSLHTGFLGILLAFFRRPIYPAQTSGAAEWGITPLEDQQLAGLVMWIPAGFIYAGAALALAGLWIARSGPRGIRKGHHVHVAR